MPTQTFFNLPQAKREKLLEAIRAEFARVPFDEVSINKIVQAAQIPRGSFYQYFTDKRDMVTYLMEDYKQVLLQRVEETLAQNGGDLLAMFEDMLRFTVDFVLGEQDHRFFRNLFQDLRINASLYRARPKDGACGPTLEALLPQVDRSRLDLRGEADLRNMLGVIMPVTGNALSEIFYDVERKEQVLARYHAQIALIGRGFLQNKA